MTRSFSPYRAALRACIKSPGLGTILNLLAEAQPNCRKTQILLRWIIGRPGVSERTQNEAVRGLIQNGGPAALTAHPLVRKASDESAALLLRICDGVPQSAPAIAALAVSRNASKQTIWNCTVRLVQMGGIAALDGVLGVLFIRRFAFTLGILTRLLTEARTLFAEPEQILSDLIVLMSNRAPKFFGSASNNKRAKKRNRRRARAVKQWNAALSQDNHHSLLITAVKALAECGAWKRLEYLVKLAPARTVGLAAAEALYKFDPLGYRPVFLTALAACDRAWMAARYLQMSEGVELSVLIGVFHSSAQREARICLASALGVMGGAICDADALTALMDTAKTDPVLTVRREALKAIARFNCREAITFLFEVAADTACEKKLPRAAKQALAAMGHKILDHVTPNANAKSAAFVLADVACGAPPRRTKRCGDLAEAITIIRREYTELDVAPVPVRRALDALDINRGRQKAASRIRSIVGCAAVSARHRDFRMLDEVETALTQLLHQPTRSDLLRQKRAAQAVFRWLVEQACGTELTARGSSPPGVLSRQILLALRSKRAIPRSGPKRVDRGLQQWFSQIEAVGLGV